MKSRIFTVSLMGFIMIVICYSANQITSSASAFKPSESSEVSSTFFKDSSVDNTLDPSDTKLANNNSDKDSTKNNEVHTTPSIKPNDELTSKNTLAPTGKASPTKEATTAPTVSAKTTIKPTKAPTKKPQQTITPTQKPQASKAPVSCTLI